MAKYSKGLVEKIVEQIEVGLYTTSEICKHLNISRAVFYKWKKENPEFAQIILEAEDARHETLVLKARGSLEKKLDGYTATETKIVYALVSEDGGEPELKVKQYEVKERYHSPETSAIIYTLEGGRNAGNDKRIKSDVRLPLTIEVDSDKTKQHLEFLKSSFEK